MAFHYASTMAAANPVLIYAYLCASLGRALGTKLIVGVNSDETITQCKGAPVMNDEERIACVRGCKFVDEVSRGYIFIRIVYCMAAMCMLYCCLID